MAVDASHFFMRFQAELEYGQAYQREYRQYEADQIARGASIDDPHFYDAFHDGRPPIDHGIRNFPHGIIALLAGTE